MFRQRHHFGLERFAVISSHGTAFWLCATLRASSTMVFSCIFPLSEISSPTPTRYDGMLTFFPLIKTCPWRTICRACERELANPDADNGVVQTPLEHDDQIFARGPLRALGFFELAELPLQQSVGALYFLFFAEVQAVSGQLLHAARLAVLTRNKAPLANRQSRSLSLDLLLHLEPVDGIDDRMGEGMELAPSADNRTLQPSLP